MNEAQYRKIGEWLEDAEQRLDGAMADIADVRNHLALADTKLRAAKTHLYAASRALADVTPAKEEPKPDALVEVLQTIEAAGKSLGQAMQSASKYFNLS